MISATNIRLFNQSRTFLTLLLLPLILYVGALKYAIGGSSLVYFWFGDHTRVCEIDCCVRGVGVGMVMVEVVARLGKGVGDGSVRVDVAESWCHVVVMGVVSVRMVVIPGNLVLLVANGN